MSERATILKAVFAMEADPERMERVRTYEEALRRGAEPALATDQRLELMEAGARVFAHALRGLPSVQRRALLNHLRHRAEILSDEPKHD